MDKMVGWEWMEAHGGQVKVDEWLILFDREALLKALNSHTNKNRHILLNIQTSIHIYIHSAIRSHRHTQHTLTLSSYLSICSRPEKKVKVKKKRGREEGQKKKARWVKKRLM